jgi:two-component system, cell cycle sensor histidine kinase and response regulator CckA
MRDPDADLPPSDSDRMRRLVAFATHADAAVILLGGVVMAAWVFDIPALRSVLPGLATMKANTALGFLLAGGALRLTRLGETSRRALWLGRSAALAVTLLALATLGEYAFGWPTGLDQLLFTDPGGGRFPGRMSPLTASCFLGCGSAILLLPIRRRAWACQLLALATGSAAGVALVGYLYSLQGLYGLSSYTSMAIHTATGFILLAAALLAARPRSALMAIATAEGAGGMLARRLLPAAVAAPVALGWLWLAGERAGLYGTELGLAIVVISTIAVLAALIWQNARSLTRLEAARQGAARSLALRESHLRGVLDSALDAVVSIDEGGMVSFWNRGAETMFGWSAGEAVGRELADLVLPARHREAHRRGLAHFAATGEGPILGRRLELSGMRRDGAEFPLELRVTALAAGETWSFNAFIADLTPRKQAAAALAHSEERYRRFFEEDLAGAFFSGPGGEIVDCNPAFARIFGFASAAAARRANLASLLPSPEHLAALLARLERERGLEAIDLELRRCDGTPLHAVANLVGSLDAGGRLAEIKGYLVDDTERRRVEEQLRQSQRLDAIGLLAGGVAHDFNNLLGVITGYAELAGTQLPPGLGRVRQYVEEIRRAGERAAALTGQLLAFSRKQLLQPRVTDLNAIVLDVEKLLRRLIGEDVDLVSIVQPGLDRVRVDPPQIEQVIMNLAINARDAMPRGGKLTLETANVLLDDEYVRLHREAKPGPHMMLAVSDTGYGMDSRTQARIFEPFFSTKGTGKGTGLGLATVYGIVKQSDGSIWVYSEPGQGTTFKIYLPRAEAIAGDLDPRIEALAPPPQGWETVLVVEDEETLRDIVREGLTAAGYAVLEARHAGEALRVCDQYRDPIHLLITDTVMPGLGGRELAQRMKALRPEIKVLYMSGYTDDAVVRHGVLTEQVAFLQKPFSLDTLARKVRAELDKPGP